MFLEKVMLAAQGYIELNMPDEALGELDRLTDDEQLIPKVLQLRLFILMRSRRWSEGLDVCARLRRISPQGTTGYLHGAFCLHELGRTNDARTLLLSGPETLQDEATYHYNLACYAAVLGDVGEARRRLEKTFELDQNFRIYAKADPDLRPIRDSI